jgi:hypothetical protein
MRCGFWIPLLATTAFAQSVEEPRPKPSDYPGHAVSERAALGAEFMVHTFGANGKMFFVENHLVVEVAFYPAALQRPMLAHSHFSLKVNGKGAIHPQVPQLVAQALKHPDWNQRRNLEVGGGAGDTGVILGRRGSGPQFPGDTGRPGSRLPNPPRREAEQDRSGIEKPEEARPEELCIEQALPEGEVSGPLRGFLYFPYTGKAKDIKKVELIYTPPKAQPVTLTLR